MWGTWPTSSTINQIKEEMLTRACASQRTGPLEDLSGEIMFSISFQHSPRLVLRIKETFLGERFSNLIFLKLNPISIHGYEVIMHGIYTDSRDCHWSMSSMSSCRAKDLVEPGSLARSGCGPGLTPKIADPGRCKGNLIPLSLICKFSNEITLSKEGVYCHL